MELQHSERKPQKDHNSSHQLESKGKSYSRMSLAVLEKQIPLQTSWPTDSVVGWGLEECCHFQSSRCLLKVNSYSVFAPPNHITNSIQAHRHTSALRSHTKGLEWENTSHTRSSWVIQCQDNILSVNILKIYPYDLSSFSAWWPLSKFLYHDIVSLRKLYT